MSVDLTGHVPPSDEEVKAWLEHTVEMYGEDDSEARLCREVLRLRQAPPSWPETCYLRDLAVKMEVDLETATPALFAAEWPALVRASADALDAARAREAEKDVALAEKDAEIARLRELCERDWTTIVDTRRKPDA